MQQGFLSATPSGRYGPATVIAVKKFQNAHGIKQLGNVGPATKNILNQLQVVSANTSTTSKQQQILQIQQEMQQLQVQLNVLMQQ